VSVPTFIACEVDTLVGVEAVCDLADAMLVSLGLGAAELSLVLTDDEGICRLNAEHRGQDRPTDVLAFPMDLAGDEVLEAAAPRVGEQLLGDVVISVPTALRQARAAGHSLAVELRFLLAHGLLHLIGYDHHDSAEKAEMDRETARLVAGSEKK
jgi:probable rRNA maturation factor